VKELPKGSTPVDFAFAIHTEVGDHCVGAKVDGKIVPLKHELASGDMVEILTSSTQTPHKDWLKFVRTSRAKTKIKHWIKLEEQKRSVEIGRRLLESEFRRHGMGPAQMFKSAELLEAARHLGFDSVEELTAAVGFGRMATSQVIGKLTAPPSGAQEPVQERPVTRKAVGGKSDGTGVQVKGSRDLLMQLSRCCHPVPGDRILGYITRGRGLTIHAVDCPNLVALDYDKERLVEVEWDSATPGTHSVKMSIVAVDKTGVLANVSSAIAECHANISRAEITTREDRKAVLDFVVEVSGTQHLDQVLKAVERIDGVITARRLRAWQERS
jgi:GTP pyrophosphokinase